MISPYLYDIWPFLWLIFSPLETADFFLCYLGFQVMAILCCVAKNSLRGTPRYRQVLLTLCFVHRVDATLLCRAGFQTPLYGLCDYLGNEYLIQYLVFSLGLCDVRIPQVNSNYTLFVSSKKLYGVASGTGQKYSKSFDSRI